MPVELAHGGTGVVKPIRFAQADPVREEDCHAKTRRVAGGRVVDRHPRACDAAIGR